MSLMTELTARVMAVSGMVEEFVEMTRFFAAPKSATKHLPPHLRGGLISGMTSRLFVRYIRKSWSTVMILWPG